MRGGWVVLALVAALVSGCSLDTVPSSAVTQCDAKISVGAAKTDILLVVDDSGSMKEEQENLRANLVRFVGALSSMPVRNDFQIGITTTSVMEYSGATSFPLSGPYAGLTSPVPYPAGALVAVDPAALTDATKRGRLLWSQADGFYGSRVLPLGSPTLLDDFSANVLVGTVGSGKEQPFRAARLALEDPRGVNGGFLRSGARLAVVFVSDEDDCSESHAPPFNGATDGLCHDLTVKQDGLDSVAAFAQFLGGAIAGERRDVVVGVIAGVDPKTLAPSLCQTTCADGVTVCGQAYDKADRYTWLLGALGPGHSYLDSICNLSFGPALEAIADLLVPQTMPLDPAPPDWHMLAVSVLKQDGSRVACPVVLAGTADASSVLAQGAGRAVYAPSGAGAPPTLTFEGGCALHLRDQVDVRLVCAG